MSRRVDVKEISQHSSPESLWIVVNGRVFDMTAFAPSHPGGVQSALTLLRVYLNPHNMLTSKRTVIYRFGGRDASEDYNAIHAPSLIVKSLSRECHIGILDEDSITEDWKNVTRASAANNQKLENSKPPLPIIVNLYDFEAAARQTLNAKAWAYINGASNDNITRDANIELLRRLWLRPAVMRNVKSTTTKTRLFGCDLKLPIYISPVGTVRLAGPEGELAFAQAAEESGIMYCISTAASYPLEEILDATAQRAFFQLYVNRDRAVTAELLKQINASGKIKALFITADLPVISKREEDERADAAEGVAEPGTTRTPGGVARQNASFIDPELSWDDIAWIRSLTPLPIIIKGIQRWEDAKLAVEYGCEGIVISNHGGRAADTAQPALVSLLELHKNCPEVFDSLEVLIDGGFRRGSDVVKAICLGASAVGFGRPFMYAANYGTEGVKYAIDSKFEQDTSIDLRRPIAHAGQVVRDEVETAMRLCGMVNLMADASPALLNSASVEALVYDSKKNFIRAVQRPKPRL